MKPRLLALWCLLVCFLAVRPALAGPDLGNKVDRSTPRRAVEVALRAATTGQTQVLQDGMDLRDLPQAKRAEEGPVLASDLARTLARIAVEPKNLSDDPEGDPLDGVGVDIVGYAPVGADLIVISVSKSGGQWLFSRATVAMLPTLREASIGPAWVRHVPASLREPFWLGNAGYQWLGVLVAFALGFVVAQLGARIFRRVSSFIVGAESRHAVAPVRGLGLAMAAVTVKLLLYPIDLRGSVDVVCERVTTTLLIVGLAAFFIRLVHDGTDVMAKRLPEDTAGELHARSVRTQLFVTRRIVTILIGTVAAALALVQFELVRTIGMSLLASAGLAGVVLGFAAQKSLAGIIAGVQISMTQPIRIGDIVVMENETGIVEEITLTFVVMKLLDDRRLIVPIARVLDQPFQNWTRQATKLTVSFTLMVGPRLPIAPLRAHLAELVEAHALWDKREASLVVGDLTDRAMVLRVNLSVSRPEHGFVLRNEIRESLVTHLQGVDGGAHLLTPRD